MTDLDDLTEPFPDVDLPPLDRTEPPAELTTVEEQWRRDGFVILPGFVPDDLIDAYEDAWLREHAEPITVAEADTPIGYHVDTDNAKGWEDACPYMRVGALRDLVCDPLLGQVLERLIGEPMGVHLNLTGWVSTQRDWHQDGYLNPDHVADWYAAVWIALEDVNPDAGPFEYVPGSHRWPTIRQAKMLDALHEPEGGLDPNWPKRSEKILTPMFDRMLEESGIEPQSFIARRGDTLIWHARLLHRGSVPNDPTLERRALIAHYSGISHREDMPEPIQHSAGGWYFPIKEKTPV